MVVINTGNIVKFRDRLSAEIFHPQLLALINKRRSGHKEVHRGQRFGTNVILIIRVADELGQRAGLVVVFNKRRSPAGLAKGPLAGK